VTPIKAEFLLDGYVAAHAEVLDISVTGLGILALDAFGAGEDYDVRLTCERSAHPRVEIQAVRVVWCERPGPHGRRRGGVRFGRRHLGTHEALERLITATCPATTSPAGA
jgi:hypothetical protein